MSKRMAAHAVENAYALGFRSAARVAREPVRRLTPLGYERVLVLAPHPDDEAIGCAGTILLHVAAGDTVTVAIATDGRRSRAIPDADAMAAQRRSEAIAAARVMGIERLQWLGLPEGEWQIPTLQSRLRGLLDELSPDIIYAPSLIDFHPEHLKVAHALALALDASNAARTRLRVYQVQVPLTSLLVNLVADISSTRNISEAALRAYESQALSVHCAYRHRRYLALRHRIPELAEAFWELPAARYIHLHRASPNAEPTAFRGLRHFPLTDPLAYLVARSARRRVRCRCHLPPLTSRNVPVV